LTLTLTLTLNAQTLLGKEDIVVSDQLNHASIIDAVKVAGVQNKFRYNHSDMGDLEKQLIAASELQHRTAEKAPPLGSARGRLLLLLRGDRPKLGCSGWLGAPTGETGPLCAHSAARAKPPPKPPRARRRELTAFEHSGRRRPRRTASTR
jgi:hypothetical protein